MARRPDDRPTNIYWLYDTRPETIAMGWTHGYPFYCGKTVRPVASRLSDHRKAAAKKPHRLVCSWVNACGDDILLKVVEIVPTSVDWCERERLWIRTLRATVPICANVTDGGEGMHGYIRSKSAVAKMRAFHLGRKRSPETRARIAAEMIGRYSDEWREQFGDAVWEKVRNGAPLSHIEKVNFAKMRAELARQRSNA